MKSLGNQTDGKAAHDRLMRGVGFIEERLDSPLILSDVAARAALSKHHFHRLFRARFGLPVMDYVRRRRLAKAAEGLIATRAPVIEIALEAGFDSQAAFTRAFRRVYHIAPAAYRTRGRNVPWLALSPISAETLDTLPGLGADSPRLVVTEAVRVAGLEARFCGEERHGIPALWHKLATILGAKGFDAAHSYGLSGGEEVLGGAIRYMAAIATDPSQPLRANLTHRDIPAGRTLVFPFRGPVTRVPAAIDYLFGAWIPGSGHVLRSAPCVERYAPGYRLGGGALELWIPVE